MSEPDSPIDPRPAPEDFLRLIQQQNRGKLKVYLGSAPGVGKTYEMLIEGNRLLKRGVDVVIGYLEAHDRSETQAQIGILETVPPKATTYHGIELREMDLPAVLARHPTIALVDELAHTNVPGSKHAKRYEDVEELMAAGVSVITTLNIQHLESLYNIVEHATGVKVKERIPDSVVARADQIINVDLPSEDLIDRLKRGKIYGQERVQHALQNFFTQRNLTRLRELTLTEVANYLNLLQREPVLKEGKLQHVGKVMVAVSSRGPDPLALLRKTSRLATQLNSDWYAVYVRTEAEAPAKVAAEIHRMLTGTLDLAQTMGGTVIILKNDNVGAALASFAKEYGITHVVMGRPEPPYLWRFFRRSPVDQLCQLLPEVDLILV
jgi:two-component system, OmpR family, sensor histidine kinase KdpD